MAKQGLDFMAVGAHPDDVELAMGGTILKLRSLGRRGVIVDVTDGGAGTRGTPEIRANEAAAAARALGVERLTLGLQDAAVVDDWESQRKLIIQIRRLRPRVLITHHADEEHPDHVHTSRLVREACYKAGLKKLDCEGTPYRPERLFLFMGYVWFEPTFCVDISDFWKGKMKAILSYRSQFHNPEAGRFKGKTDLSTPAFLENHEIRCRFLGGRIKRKYAEAFRSTELPEVADMCSLGGARFT